MYQLCFQFIFNRISRVINETVGMKENIKKICETEIKIKFCLNPSKQIYAQSQQKKHEKEM